jgi:D-serine deaminase-like pyridoxal phosphate-dependent protein
VTICGEFEMLKYDLDTPALLLDADILEANIAKMASFARQEGVNLRPHCKTHKAPIIARKQLEAGAIGITCQKLGEAEVMVDEGIEGLLIANQIVGETKIRRLISLAGRADVMVAVDDPRNISNLSAAASGAGIRLKVLVEVDVGMGRCGVPPDQPSLALTRLVHESPGLEFCGLMGYEGHTVMIDDVEEREAKARQALSLLVETVELLKGNGFKVPIVSSSGTGTFDIGGGFPGITEIQVGSYATMDGRYRQVGVPFDCALTVLTSVISTPTDGIVVTDAGVKSVTIEFGWPQVLGYPDAEVVYLSEEHGKLKIPDSAGLNPGDKLEFLPMHGCTTINLHDHFYVVRDDEFQERWQVAARGRSR